MIHEQLKTLAVPLGTVQMDPHNARRRTPKNLEAIKNSLTKFGQRKAIVVNKATGYIEAGNGTYQAAQELGWQEIAAIFVEDGDKEAKAYAIADNRTSELAEWDEDELLAQLQDLEDTSELGFDDEDIKKLAEECAGPDEPIEPTEDTQASPYTAKVAAPIYEPKGERPPINDLTDKTKTIQLCEEIRKADIPEDIRGFLLTAAQRHTVFNFRNIAEFYCHATPEVQELMERSGLIIIDFNKAIEYGFIHMSERLGAIADIGVDDDDASENESA